MNIDTLLDRAGMTTADLARSIGVAPTVVFQWRKGLRPVPLRHCAAIELATDGAVARRDLRPDDWHLIWPELKETSHV